MVTVRASPAASLRLPTRLRDEFSPGAVGIGWELGLIGLGTHLATGASVDPSAAAQCMASEAGRTFIALSSERWREASVSAGTDPVAAAAAWERVTAAYTGAPAASAE